MDAQQTKKFDKTNFEKVITEFGFSEEIKRTLVDPRVGNRCPFCRDGLLDYDGLLNLVCQDCGFTCAGCST